MADDLDKKVDLDKAEMADDMDKEADPNDDAEMAKVIAAAEAKQQRYRLDEFVAITIGVGAVLILWLLQWLGLY
jgi:hypothetical protein